MSLKETLEKMFKEEPAADMGQFGLALQLNRHLTPEQLYELGEMGEEKGNPFLVELMVASGKYETDGEGFVQAKL
jgi:hypothetical protein